MLRDLIERMPNILSVALSISFIMNMLSIYYLRSLNLDNTGIHGLDLEGIFLPSSQYHHYSTNDNDNIAAATISSRGAEDFVEPIEKVLILATVPFDAAHALATW